MEARALQQTINIKLHWNWDIQSAYLDPSLYVVDACLSWVILLVILIATNYVHAQETGNTEARSCHDCTFTVQRVNYGTIFLPYNSIVLAENRWLNVFKINMLEDIAPLPLWLDCSEIMGNDKMFPKTSTDDYDMCESLTAKLHMVHTIRESFLKTFSAEIEEADKLTAHHKRTKRDTGYSRYPSTAHHHRRADLMPHEELGARDDLQQTGEWQANLTRITMVKDALGTIDDMTKEAISAINDTYKQMSRVLNEAGLEGINTKRRRRGVVSSVLYHVFGVARKSDVLRMQDMVNRLEMGQIETGKQLEQFQNEMLSTMALSNDRISNLAEGLGALNNQIVALTTQFRKWEILHHRGLNEVLQILVAEIRSINTLQNTLSTYMDGVMTLATGQLSPHLIDIDTLQNALNNIDKLLQSDFPGHALIEKEASYYYRYSHPLFERAGDSLYVTLVFPISVLPYVFKVFQINVLPQAVGNNTDRYTKLIMDKDYIAIAEDGMHYIELSESQIQRCEDGQVKHCTEFLPVQNYLTHPTCLMAIYKDDLRKTKELCEYHLFLGQMKSEIREIGNNKFLITNAKTILTDCRSQEPSILNPTQAVTVLNIPCMCDITVDGIWIPARISSCDMDTPTFTIEYPINLPLLQELYDIDLLGKITGDATYSKEMLDSIQLPDYLQSKDSPQGLASKDADLNIRIKDAISHMRQHGSFMPQTDLLRKYHPETFYSQSTGLNWPLILGVVALISIGVIILILFLYRHKWGKWVGLLSQFALPHASADADFPTINLNRKQALLLVPDSPIPSEPVQETTPDPLLLTIIVLQIVILLICIGIIWYKWLKSRRNDINLVLQLVGQETTIDITLCPLTIPVAHMHFQADTPISDIGISGQWFRPRLRLYHDLTVGDKQSILMVRVPTRVPISLWQVYPLRHVLAGQFAVVMKVLQGNQFIYLNQVCSSSCTGEQCDISQSWSYHLHHGKSTIMNKGAKRLSRKWSFKGRKEAEIAATCVSLCEGDKTKGADSV